MQILKRMRHHSLFSSMPAPVAGLAQNWPTCWHVLWGARRCAIVSEFWHAAVAQSERDSLPDQPPLSSLPGLCGPHRTASYKLFDMHGSRDLTAPLLSRCMMCLPLLQVYDLSEYRPDKVLSTIWANLRQQEQQGNQRAAVVRSRLRILACGGDGTVAWIFKVIRELDLQPQPPVAIMPLGTGMLLLLRT